MPTVMLMAIASGVEVGRGANARPDQVPQRRRARTCRRPWRRPSRGSGGRSARPGGAGSGRRRWWRGLSRHGADRRAPRRRCQVPEVMTGVMSGHDRAQSRPSARARSAAWVRSRAPSLASTLVTWFLTVPSARNSARGDLPVAVALGEQAQHRRARGPTAARPAAAAGAPASSGSVREPGHHLGRDRRLQHRLAAGGGEHRLDQPVATRRP